MPIDLKWVRTDPDQVREWQNLRRRRPNDDNDDDDQIDLVDAVLRKDELSRKQLQILQEYKTSLKQLQLRLRPTKKPPTDDNNNNSKSESESTPLSTPPPSNTSTNRQVLMEEKKVLEEKIKKAETVWKASLKDTQEALCKLASPVTEVVGDAVDASPSPSSLVSPPSMAMLNSHSYSTYSRSSIGMDLEQAWKQYTLRHFASYLWVELPRGVPVVRQRRRQQAEGAGDGTEAFSIDPDRAHGLWGCCCCDNSTSSSASASTASTSTSCPICKVAKADDPPIVMLPAWIRLLTEFLPNKTIWGERELPRYTALWSNNNSNSNDTTTPASSTSTSTSPSKTICWLGHPEQGEQDSSGVLPSSSSSSFSLELVAIAASSVVDAREIQNDLVEELFNYYGGLLLVGGGDDVGGSGSGEQNESSKNKNKLLKRIVAAPDLNSHEWSRVEIHVQLQYSDDDLEEENNIDVQNNNHRNTLRLGWVSHWGDAASRACDMSFAGGGVVRAGGKKSKYKSKSNKYNNNNKSTRDAATKEYVHVIQASVVDNSSSTWNKILYANSNLNANANANANCSTDDVDVDFSSRRKEKRVVLVDVPPVIIPYLIRPLPSNYTSSIPLEELVLDSNSKNKKKKETVFGVRDDTTRTTAHNKQQQQHQQQPVITSNSSRMELVTVGTGDTRTQDGPKFPPFVLPPSMSKEQLQQRIRWEKLSCPFDFVFE